MVSLPVTHSVNFALTGEVTNGVANAASVPKVLAKFSASRLRTKHQIMTMTLLSKSSSAKSTLQSKVKGSFLGADSGAVYHSWVLIAVLIQLQRLRVPPEFSAAKLGLQHYAVLIASAVMRRTKHHPELRFQSPLVLSPLLQLAL